MLKYVIEGSRGAGKSTLIKRLAAGFPRERITGFYTEKVDFDAGLSVVYIHDAAGDERTYSDANAVCVRNDGEWNVRERLFDAAAREYLASAGEGSVVIMDELGFLERNAAVFCARVLEVFNSDAIAIAAIKQDVDVPLLNQIRIMESVCRYRLDAENRDLLYLRIVADMRERGIV
ncbi:MAG: nucleoside-triphosphatase [Clostridia bacterium]|nr:nucleoside-triphosphatase [Clostridia bacterium]